MADAALDVQVKAAYKASQSTYGRPRITQALRSEHNVQVGHEWVRQSLLLQGLAPVYKRHYKVTTDSDHTLPIAANVLDHRFNGWERN